MNREYFISIMTVLCLALVPAYSAAQVITGAERTELYFPLLKDRHAGVVANRASMVRSVNIVDLLVRQGVQVTRIFSPEHGFRMSAEAGETIGNSVDSATGIPVVSLYGARKKPSAADLEGIDLVVFDIQDVGVRFYTYISTLSYVMESCAEQNIPLLVLDRPNPNGFYIDGPVLEKEYASFVGMHPVPVVYGMTIGEYAGMVNGEGWLKSGLRCDLTVISLLSYTRQSPCAIPVPPSPNLPNMESVYLYPSLCFFEGTDVSIGRGTAFPFQVCGHPGFTSGEFFFTPESISGFSVHPPQEGKRCRGEDLRNFYGENPREMGKINLKWLLRAFHQWKDTNSFFTPYFEKLAGTAKLRKQILRGKTENEIRRSWQPAIEQFRKTRSRYLLY